jgi:hypothetical protein
MRLSGKAIECLHWVAVDTAPELVWLVWTTQLPTDHQMSTQLDHQNKTPPKAGLPVRTRAFSMLVRIGMKEDGQGGHTCGTLAWRNDSPGAFVISLGISS